MKPSLASPSARWAILAASLLSGVPLIYFGFRNARAEHFAGLQTLAGLNRAVQIEPANPLHWYLLGRYWHYNFDEPNLPRAISYYQHALALDPHAARIWLDLAGAYEQENRFDEAGRAYSEARKAYPISPEVSWRYGNFLLRQGETSLAFAEIRNAVAGDPKLASAAVSRCWRSSHDVEAILSQALPPSRETYLEALRFFVGEREAPAALATWQRLAGVVPALPAAAALPAGASLPLKESFPLLDLLTSSGRVADARDVWDQALSLAAWPKPPAEPASLVWDGGFETDLARGGLGWRTADTPGVRIDFDRDSKHSGTRALRIRFDGSSNFDFRGVFQYVLVEPATTYRLSGWLRSEDVSTDSGVRLFAYDPRDPTTTGRPTPDVLGTEPWHKVELTLTTGRETRVLVLGPRRFPSTKLDNKLRGTVWLDDVALAPLTARAKTP
jgi:tetratricopeptide (TPR) repeat protein